MTLYRVDIPGCEGRMLHTWERAQAYVRHLIFCGMDPVIVPVNVPAICPHGLREDAECFDCRWAA